MLDDRRQRNRRSQRPDFIAVLWMLGLSILLGAAFAWVNL